MRLRERMLNNTYTRALIGSMALIAALALNLPLARAGDTSDGTRSAQPVPDASPVPPGSLGVSFVEGSSTTMIIEREGKKYLVDLRSQTIKEVEVPSASPQSSQDGSQNPAKTLKEAATAKEEAAKKQKIYEPGDDFVYTLPTGRRLDRHGFYVNFNHRFAFNSVFTGKARGHVLGGLDDFSLSSLGIRYGVTKDFSVSIYRSPSVIGRPIEMMAAYNLLDEHDGKPINAAVRFSVDGENDFSKNFTANFEGVFSRSLGSRAQLYVVPTLSIQNRPLVPPQAQLFDPVPDLPGFNTFSLGVGGAFDIRPSVAIVAEVIPTLANGPEMGIHRPAYSIGIQKRLWRHAFTFGVTNGPGTTVAQRAGTRAQLLADPSADKPSGLFIGFDLTRQIF